MLVKYCLQILIIIGLISCSFYIDDYNRKLDRSIIDVKLSNLVVAKSDGSTDYPSKEALVLRERESNEKIKMLQDKKYPIAFKYISLLFMVISGALIGNIISSMSKKYRK